MYEVFPPPGLDSYSARWQSLMGVFSFQERVQYLVVSIRVSCTINIVRTAQQRYCLYRSWHIQNISNEVLHLAEDLWVPTMMTVDHHKI